VREALDRRGVPTAVHYPVPLHAQEAFADGSYPAGAFPHAEKASRQVLSLPMHPYLTDDEVAWICRMVEEVVVAEYEENEPNGG
jgi:UDP-2-acetamido-2-deoxy-ribo-hexuluronate aminotransferase